MRHCSKNPVHNRKSRLTKLVYKRRVFAYYLNGKMPYYHMQLFLFTGYVASHRTSSVLLDLWKWHGFESRRQNFCTAPIPEFERWMGKKCNKRWQQVHFEYSNLRLRWLELWVRKMLTMHRGPRISGFRIWLSGKRSRKTTYFDLNLNARMK